MSRELKKQFERKKKGTEENMLGQHQKPGETKTIEGEKISGSLERAGLDTRKGNGAGTGS